MGEEAIERVRTVNEVQGLSQIPGAEPTLAQLDEWQRDILIGLCYEDVPVTIRDDDGAIKVVLDEEGKVIFRRICLYPEILALTTSISHLEGTSNYTWEQSHYIFLDWEELEWKPIADRYARDHKASTILHAIKGIKRRQVYGDCQGGSRQRFVVQVGGSEQMFRILGEEKKKRGFLGLW